MTPKEAMQNQKTVEVNDAWLKRLQREDEGEYRNSHSDPEFTVEELARIMKRTPRHVRGLLRDAKVGFPALRRDIRGNMQKTIIVRWSQLREVAQENGWF